MARSGCDYNLHDQCEAVRPDLLGAPATTATPTEVVQARPLGLVTTSSGCWPNSAGRRLPVRFPHVDPTASPIVIARTRSATPSWEPSWRLRPSGLSPWTT